MPMRNLEDIQIAINDELDLANDDKRGWNRVWFHLARAAILALVMIAYSARRS